VNARFLAALTTFLFAASVSGAATAQSWSALNRILFDPQPLPPGPSAAPAPQPVGQASPVSLPTDPGVDAEPAAQDIDDYLQSIAMEELQGGPFAPELMEQYFALGEVYQRQGEHDEALTAFEKADYVSRINNGLYTPQQFAIVENMIASHLAQGEIAEAQQKQQYLFFLNRQYYGDKSLQIVPALETLADWNLDAFRALLNQRNTSNLVMQLRAPRGINTENPKVLAFGNLYQARNNYHQAITNMIGHGQFADPKLVELEHKMVETEFLAASRQGILSNPEFYLDQQRVSTGSRISRNYRNSSLHFINGRNGYRRVRLYQENLPDADPVAIAQTILSLADWHLLFQRQISALDHYREAQRYLVEHGVPEATISSLLTPAIPQQLPTFTPLPNSRAKFGLTADATVPYDGHIDVRFHVSRFGNVGRIEVLERSETATADIERRLRRLLHSSPFRPRFVAGELARSDAVTLRYYFAHMN
jgi:tetratricopeptide (TPR) repeat protein